MNVAAQPDDQTRKDFDALRARAALAGHQLYRSAAEDGGIVYFVARWGMVKTLGSVEEVSRWLDRIDGRAPTGGAV